MTDLQKRIKVYQSRLINLNDERGLLAELNTETENAIMDTKIGMYMEFLGILESLLPAEEKAEMEQENKTEDKPEHEEVFVETSDKPNNFFIHEEPENQPEKVVEDIMKNEPKQQAKTSRSRKPVAKNGKSEPMKQEPIAQTKSRRTPANLKATETEHAQRNVVVVSTDKGSFSIVNETGGSIESGFQTKPSAMKYAKDKGWNVVSKIKSAPSVKR